MRRWFEFSIYLNLLLLASLFIFILALNEVAELETKTTNVLSSTSLAISILMLMIMGILMIFPMFICCMNHKRLVEICENYSELQTFGDKVTYNFITGLKTSKLAALYTTMFLLRRLIQAIMIIFFTSKLLQLSTFIVINLIFIVYMLIVRPFSSKLQNFMSLLNEIIFMVCCLMMLLFFDTGSTKDSIGVAMIILFSVNIVLCFSVSIIFSIFLCVRKNRQTNVKEMIDKDGVVKRYMTQKAQENHSFHHNDIELKPIDEENSNYNAVMNNLSQFKQNESDSMARNAKQIKEESKNSRIL
mmetsp:Transcript_42173/g.48961  ORF Transcript_42173/g.48961 Transcript_42173/m.48961 type:complete len:301 (-) Transcript_42173:21-923(-)